MSDEVEIITATDLTELFFRVRQGVRIGLITESLATDLRKFSADKAWENIHYGQTLRVTHSAGIIGAQYKTTVERQQKRERKPQTEEFEPEQRSWGRKIGTSILLHHNGKLYFDFRSERTLSTQYLVAGTREELPKPDVELFLRKRNLDSAKARQGVDKPIKWRTPALASVRELRMDGKRYQIKAVK